MSAICTTTQKLKASEDVSYWTHQVLGPDSSQTCLDDEDEYSVKGMPCNNLVMVEGSGAYLWDTKGDKYLDFNGGFSSANQGHCHPKIVEAVVSQARKLAMPGRATHNELYGKSSKYVCEMFGFDKVAMLNGGAEATDMAIKIARAWGYRSKGIQQDKALVLMPANNYHGRTLSVVSGCTSKNVRQNCGPFMPGIGSDCTGHAIRYGEIDDVRKAFSSHGSDIAAFMLECVQGGAGSLPASKEYLQELAALCKQHNILLIADEIQCGLGRAGAMLAYEPAGIKPDLVVLGKSLSGGLYPVSAVLGRREIMDSVAPSQYGSTFSGNPIACAAVMAALNVIQDEKLVQRSRDLGLKLEKKLATIELPYLDRAQGVGLFWSLFVRGQEGTANRLVALLQERGIFSNATGERIRIAPPLVIEEDALMCGIDTIAECLQLLEKQAQ